MALIKKVDVKAYFVAGRGLGIAAAAEASKQIANKRVKIGLADARPAGARMTSAEFLQDFCLEHSSQLHSSLEYSSQVAPVFLVAGRSGSPQVPTVTRNLHA